jgi:Zn-dependent peptidase ImmA (M78 family)
MKKVVVTLHSTTVKWIINKIQNEKQYISDNILATLDKWENGEKNPTFKQVESMSKKTNIPFGYFFLETPPIETCPLVEHRTIGSNCPEEPSRNLLDTIDNMGDIQNWMRKYLKGDGAEPLDFVGKFKNNSDIVVIANDIRQELDLKLNWFFNIKNVDEAFDYSKNIINNVGILIMMSGIVGQNTHRKLDVSEFRAFTLVDKYAPLIFINSCDSKPGKLFSLWHGVAHIWLGTDNLFNDKYGTATTVNKLEKICNAIAAEIMVPNNLFLSVWNDSKAEIESKIDTISNYFKCGKSVIIRRALDNQLITKEKYDEFSGEIIERFNDWQNKKKGSGGNYYNAMNAKFDHRFIKALASSTAEGKTQYTDAYRLTNITNRVTFDNIVKVIERRPW